MIAGPHWILLTTTSDRAWNTSVYPPLRCTSLVRITTNTSDHVEKADSRKTPVYLREIARDSRKTNLGAQAANKGCLGIGQGSTNGAQEKCKGFGEGFGI